MQEKELFQGYIVTQDGHVFAVSHGVRKELKQFHMSRNGKYRAVSIKINGKPKTQYVHRLVALAFIPNPDNLPQVNHIDGNPGNNNVENLEWCTPSQNIAHAYSTGLFQKSECVVCGKIRNSKRTICKTCCTKVIDVVSDVFIRQKRADDVDGVQFNNARTGFEFLKMRSAGMSIGEIAKEKGCTRQNVSYQLLQAKKEIDSKLNNKEHVK